MKRSVFLVVLLALVATSGLAFGQTDQTGVVEGVVLAPNGEPVADATVSIAMPDGSHAKTVVTEADGSFRIPFLVPGNYGLVARGGGYNPWRAERLRVNAARSVRLEIKLPETHVEEITVVDAAPLIDETSTELGTTIEAAEIEELPLSRRATGLLVVSPGVRENQAWGGVASQANSYQLDGVSVNQPGYGGSFLLPNVDWIEELQVRGLGAGAEYGNFQGGLVNIVTKSGSNTFEGSLRMNFESEGLAASNLNAGEQGEQRDKRFEINANVAGPIVKDKLYYFFSVQELSTDTKIVDTANSAEGVSFLDTMRERTERKLFGKLSWQATENDLFHFVLGRDEVEEDNRGLSSFTAPEAAQTQDSPTNFWNLSWNRVLGPKSFLEVKFTGYDGEDKRDPLNGDRPGVQEIGGQRRLFTNAVYSRLREPKSVGFSARWDLFRQTGSWTHHFKIGGEHTKGSWLETRTRNGGFTWRPEGSSGVDPSDPDTWGFISSDWGGAIRLDTENTNSAIYVQDDITVTERLKITPGVRWGRWEGEITPGDGSADTFTAIKDDAIDPRFGIVFDVLGDDRWVAKAHWGRYHQSMFALLYDRIAGGNVFQDTEYWDWDSDELPDPNRVYTLDERDQFFTFYDDSPASSYVGVADSYDQPYLDQLVLGIEHAFTPNFKLGLTYINRKNKNIVALVDRNLESNWTEFQNVTLQIREVPEGGGDAEVVRTIVLPSLYVSNDDIIYEGAAPGLSDDDIASLSWNPDYVLTNAPGATRTLDQLQLEADWRGAKWRVNASLVWSDLTGNFNSVSGYENSASGTGVGGYVRPNSQVNWQGDLPNSSEWEAKVRVRGELFWGLRLGAFLRYYSGDKWTASYEIDRRDDDIFLASNGEEIDSGLLYSIHRESLFVDPRGAREHDSQFLCDLSLDRDFKVGDLDLVVGIDVFNVFNDDTVLGRETFVDEAFSGGAQLGAPTRRVAPREMRLSAAIHW